VLAADPDGGNPVLAPFDASLMVRGDDAALTRSAPSGRESLRGVLKRGPENGTWVIAHFSNVPRMDDTLKGSAIGSDYRHDIGGYVAYGIQPADLNGLAFGGQAAVGSSTSGVERSERGTYRDRYERTTPRTVIPYGHPKSSD